MSGTPLEVLQKMGGWKTLEMVQRYAHLAPGYIARYVEGASLTISPTAAPMLVGTTVEDIEFGVIDGARTHDNRNHKTNPANLYCG